MARRAKRSAARTKAAKPVKERRTRKEVEVVDEDAGPGWETGVAVLTGVIIFVAILIVDYGLGKYNGDGIFF